MRSAMRSACPVLRGMARNSAATASLLRPSRCRNDACSANAHDLVASVDSKSRDLLRVASIARGYGALRDVHACPASQFGTSLRTLCLGMSVDFNRDEKV